MTTTDRIVCRYCGSSTGIFCGESCSVWLCRDLIACSGRVVQQAEETASRLRFAMAAEVVLRELRAFVTAAFGPNEGLAARYTGPIDAALALLEETT